MRNYAGAIWYKARSQSEKFLKLKARRRAGACNEADEPKFNFSEKEEQESGRMFWRKPKRSRANFAPTLYL